MTMLQAFIDSVLLLGAHVMKLAKYDNFSSFVDLCLRCIWDDAVIVRVTIPVVNDEPSIGVWAYR